MDDVCAIVGWSRAVSLTLWFGNSNLYVPATPDDDHVLLTLLGRVVLQRLINEFGGTTVWIPSGGNYGKADQLKCEVRRMVLRGCGSRQMAAELGISQRQAQRIRLALEASNMLPKILGEKSQGKTPLKKGPHVPRPEVH